MEPNTELPASVIAAMRTDPIWLQAWVALLAITVLAALFFRVERDERGVTLRREPLAILVAFAIGGALMEWLYAQVGYVRLLGLAHLVTWGPAWYWILGRRRTIGTESSFGKYIHTYLIVAGICLVIDVIDLVRYLVGDGELLNRWS